LDEHSASASGAVPGALKLKGYKGYYYYTLIHIPIELYGGRMGTHAVCVQVSALEAVVTASRWPEMGSLGCETPQGGSTVQTDLPVSYYMT
jgi:hypothetical protein